MHDALALMILSTELEMGYSTLAGSLRASSLLWESVRSPRSAPLHHYRGVAVVVVVLRALIFGVLWDSSSGFIGALRYHPCACHGYVHYWWSLDIWHYYLFHNVFPGGVGLLGVVGNCHNGIW